MRRLVLPEKKGYSGEGGLGLRGEGGRRHPYIDACRRRGGLDLLFLGTRSSLPSLLFFSPPFLFQFLFGFHPFSSS